MTGGPTRALVLHVGDSPESAAGGISRVIRGHLARDLEGIRIAALPSFDPQARSFLRRQRPAFTAIARLVLRGVVRPGTAVLHVHVSRGFSHVREGLLALLGRCLGWRVVVTWHASTGMPRGRVGRAALGGALRAAHAVTVLSPAHAEVVPVRRDKVVVLPNDVPVPPTVPAMSEREHWVVFAGEFGVRKGADVLLAAWSALPDALRSGWTLHVHGRVAGEFADAGGTDPSVRLHGLSPSEEVLDRLGRASVAVLPSRAEALPMFLLEAMSSGCAVVGSGVGGVPSLLRDGAGVVVPAGDAAALATVLGDLLGSLELRERISRAGRTRVGDEYSTTGVDQRWRQLYGRLADLDRAPATGTSGAEAPSA